MQPHDRRKHKQGLQPEIGCQNLRALIAANSANYFTTHNPPFNANHPPILSIANPIQVFDDDTLLRHSTEPLLIRESLGGTGLGFHRLSSFRILVQVYQFCDITNCVAVDAPTILQF